MEAIAAELMDTGAKRDVRGRRLAARREREALITAYEASGLTPREFAEREGIKFFTFTAWLKRHRERGAKRTFAEVKVTKGAAPSILEVALPGGAVVRGTEVEQVAALVRALGVC
jgi:transposase-like protein